MKKHIILILAFILISVSNLSAKTIWIVDETSDSPSIVSMRNTIIEDLNISKYQPYFKIVQKSNDVDNEKGDLVINLLGFTNSTTCGNISVFFVIDSIVDNCYEWAYYRNMHFLFTDHFIDNYSRNARNSILSFLDEHFDNKYIPKKK